MKREYYLDLAQKKLRMPVGADLVLREKPDHDAILCDGARLGQVIIEAAQRYQTPLAFPVMDLNLEKVSLLQILGISPQEALTFHFETAPDISAVKCIETQLKGPLNARLQANIDAVGYVAKNSDLVPVGMCIGPFSLSTKLMSDPITAVFMAGSGMAAEDDPDVELLESALRLALAIIKRSMLAQIEAGAKAFFIAEPAANKVYFSPNQLQAGADIFERYVLAPNREIKAILDAAGVDLIFHCCGELIDDMVRDFCSLRPVILSLGSSRVLWEDAALVPDDVVLFGNLPTKRFYSDNEITADEVTRMACELEKKMRATGQPFILGSECDVLSVPGCHEIIAGKVKAFMQCGCG